MKAKLNPKFLDRDWRITKRVTYTDDRCRNLMVVIDPNGGIYWRWQGKINGVVRQASLGRYPAVSPDEARQAASDLTDKRDLAKQAGESFELPRKVKRPLQIAAAPTISAPEPTSAAKDCDWLWDLYMKHEGSAKASSTEKQRSWDKDIKPFIGHKPYAEITYDDLAEVIVEKAKSAPGASNHLVAYLKRLFRWATTKGRPFTRLETDPAMHLVKISETNAVDRYLDENEIALFFKTAAAFGDTFSDALVLSLYTGVRKSEAFDMPWTEYESRTGIWTIPKERAKNGDELILPLATTCQTLLKARREATGEGLYVFPSNRGDQPMGGFTKAMNRFRDKMVEIATKERGEPVVIPNWTIHDLRRTLSTGMNGLTDDSGDPLIPAEIVERVLNHRIKGVAGVYNRHAYLPEKRRALLLWSEYLDALRAKALQPAMKQAA